MLLIIQKKQHKNICYTKIERRWFHYKSKRSYKDCNLEVKDVYLFVFTKKYIIFI